MNKLVIYCKSYNQDVYRAKELLESINKFNRDNIPFYISVPSRDIDLFKDILGEYDYTLIKDEDIDSINEGWKGQQIVKSQFWKLGLCENYVCIDSDCIFIKDFYVNDFMFDDDTPYTIMHEYKSLFEFLDKKSSLPFDPYESFSKERKQVMDLFGRKSRVLYDFGPGPTIWSAKVWKSLIDNYAIPNNLTFSDLINAIPSEFTWYGEWVLATQPIRLIPRGPLFKNYHYEHQYKDDRQHNYNIEKIKKLYLGIGMQSIYNFN